MISLIALTYFRIGVMQLVARGSQESIIGWLFGPQAASKQSETPTNCYPMTGTCANVHTHTHLHTNSTSLQAIGWAVITSRCKPWGGSRSAKAMYYMHAWSQPVRDTYTHTKKTKKKEKKTAEKYLCIPVVQCRGTETLLKGHWKPAAMLKGKKTNQKYKKKMFL